VPSNTRTPDRQHTAAAEDYLKTIFALASAGDAASVSQIATRLGVSRPSASVMLKRLTDDGLVERVDRHRHRLTRQGRADALRIVRRHRLIEAFLASTLDMTWDEVHAEAELLEHAVSDRLEERIDAALGHPTHDPHGDPIPPPDGDHDEAWPEPLAQAPVGARFRVERVSDRDSAALRYLDRLGVRPGARLTVGERDPFGGPLWIEIDGRREALGGPLARIVHGTVEPS
jgi:DtxR family transcriptional regulator, Mn-dependent transcriptional regulator